MWKNSKIFILLVFLLAVSCDKNSLKKVELEKIMFGTSIKIIIYDEDEKKAKILAEESFKLMEEIEKKYGSRSPKSLVWEINKNPTKIHTINQEFYYLMKECEKVSNFTEGRFDITVNPLMTLWGFDRLEIETIPTKSEIEKVKKWVSYKDIKLSNTTIVLAKENQKIDTGAFLKGYAIHKGKEFLLENGIKSAMITAISSIETIGTKPDNKPFRIGIQNPQDGNKLLYTIDLEGHSLGVSGDYQTFVEINGKKYHHILDATTGYPSEYNSMVLVLGKDAFKCDLYSTALFTMKAEEILKFAQNEKSIEVFIVDKNGKQYFSEGIKKYINDLTY